MLSVAVKTTVFYWFMELQQPQYNNLKYFFNKKKRDFRPPFLHKNCSTRLSCRSLYSFFFAKYKRKNFAYLCGFQRFSKKRKPKFDKLYFCDYNISVNLKTLLLFNFYEMEKQIKTCEALRNKSKKLWLDYLKEPNLHFRTVILKQRKKTTEKLLEIQSKISQLLLSELKQWL